MDKAFIQTMMRNAIGMLHIIDTADMEEYVNGVSANNSMYDAVGPILDPSEYRDTLHSGRRDKLRMELGIAQKLLEIRKLMDELKIELE